MQKNALLLEVWAIVFAISWEICYMVEVCVQQHFCQVWVISHHPPCQLQPLSATKLNPTCFTVPLKATLSITSRRIFCCLFFDSIISFPMSSLCTHVPLRVCRHPICILEDFRVLDFLKLKRCFFSTNDGWDWLDLFWLLKLFQYDFRQTGNSIKCPTYPTDTSTPQEIQNQYVKMNHLFLFAKKQARKLQATLVRNSAHWLTDSLTDRSEV